MRDPAEVTAAEIARLAGVGRAAVGNWRKRYADFPKPVGGSTGSPTFRLTEVERWLVANNRAPKDDPRRRIRRLLLWPAGATEPDEHVLRLAEEILDLHQAKARRAPAGKDKTAQGRANQGMDPVIRELVAEVGAAATFDLLLEAFLEEPSNTGHTPPNLAELMAHLAKLGDATHDDLGGRVHDPACGVGTLLVAALRAGATSATGQDADPRNAAMARVRLALRQSDESQIRTGSLQHDEFPEEHADVVLCHPPFAVRNWGADELAYDERWEFGVPSKQESELAWVEHCLARVRPGGTVVILLPPAVAARGSGRRIRAELLRRGALRAVFSLPSGMAVPSHLSLHLWLLTRPTGAALANTVLLVDASTVDTSELAATLTTAVQGSESEVAARLPVVDLLDEEVDLTPARHLAGRAATIDAADVVTQRDRLAAALIELAGRLPLVRKLDDPTVLHMTTVADLARSGALSLHTQPGTAVEPGDVLVTYQGPDLHADVAAGQGELGPNRALLRADPKHLDPWFLAGFLARPSNYRLISSLGSTQRLDIRRATVPRLPLERQRAFATIFEGLQTFRDCLKGTAENGQTVANLVAEGLAAGTLTGQT
jgi:predicted RNA methylase